MTNPLRKIYEVHNQEHLIALRDNYNSRYVGQEDDIGGDLARIDLFDDDNNTQMMVYCPVNLLPDPSFWSE